MRRTSLTLIAFVIVIVVLIGVRYQWQRAHRTPRAPVTAVQRDSLYRDSTAEQNAPDTMCFASRLGLPCA